MSSAFGLSASLPGLGNAVGDSRDVAVVISENQLRPYEAVGFSTKFTPKKTVISGNDETDLHKLFNG